MRSTAGAPTFTGNLAMARPPVPKVGAALAESPVQVTGITSAVSLASDAESSFCAVLKAGSVECWGKEGGDGELGNGTQIGPQCPNVGCSDTPVGAEGLTNATSIGTGGDLGFCAVLSTGGIDCWGSNAYGTLGDGNLQGYSDVPVAVSGLGG